MAKGEQWKLNPAEVTWGTSLYWHETDPFDVVIKSGEKHSISPGGPGYRSKISQPRNYKKTIECPTMTHVPTGIQSHGRFAGFYTRGEIQELHKELLNKLFQNLEDKVAKHLKVRGRSVIRK